MNHLICPICQHSNPHTRLIGPDPRTYWLCNNCSVIFADPSSFLSEVEEKERYDLHNNDEDDPRYIKFLSQAIDMAIPFLKESDKVLDFGCGPVMALLNELKRKVNCKITPFDPFYFPDDPSDNAPFDCIFSTEVFEHLNNPQNALSQIDHWLKPNGYLCIMTQMYPTDLSTFQNWYYARDPTHVVFYSKATFEFLQKRYGWTLIESDQSRVFLFQKN